MHEGTCRSDKKSRAVHAKAPFSRERIPTCTDRSKCSRDMFQWQVRATHLPECGDTYETHATGVLRKFCPRDKLVEFQLAEFCGTCHMSRLRDPLVCTIHDFGRSYLSLRYVPDYINPDQK